MAIYYPRHHLELFVPVFGATRDKQKQIRDTGAIKVPCALLRSELERNNHKTADVLNVEFDWRTCGVDPRMLSSARGKFYLGDARGTGAWVPTDDDLQFCGIVTKANRKAGAGRAMTVELEFHDYTSFFLNQKLDPKFVPSLSDTLPQAWRKICKGVGFYNASTEKVVTSVEDLNDNLLFLGDEATALRDVAIGKAAPPRYRKQGKVQSKPGADAWAVWQQCCGMLGLITYFKLDSIILATSTDFFTAEDPPVLIWGQNIYDWNEESGTGRAHKGICLQSFNASSGTLVEAFYPPPGDPRIKTKRIVATKHGDGGSAEIQSEAYEPPLAVPGISDQARLEFFAKRVYDEWSRQQVEGQFTTHEMRLSTVGGADFRFYALAAGECVRIQFDGDTLIEASSRLTDADRIEYLIGLGYSRGAAELITANLESFSRLQPLFHVKSSRTSLETTPEGGKFQVAVHYHNLVDPLGAIPDEPEPGNGPNIAERNIIKTSEANR